MENIPIEELGLDDLAQKKNMFQDYLNTLPEKALGLGIRTFIVLALFLVGYWLIRLLRRILRKSLERTKVSPASIRFIDNCVRIVLYIVLILSLVEYFGVDAASIVALIGSGALTIGLAFQGSLSNFAGGVLILVCKPFVTGDYILEKSTQTEGTVEEINLFYTKIRTMDNRMISMPNSVLSNSTIVDASAFEERRVDLIVPVSYGTEVEKARGVILKVLDRDGVLSHDRNVFVDSLDNSSVLLGVQFFVSTPDYLMMKRLVLEEIKTEFDRTGITIPFEQIDVHMV